MSLRGVDVSQHQGSVLWNNVRNAGYSFAICKATEGEDFRDGTFTAGRVRQIRQAGLKLGVYHYLRPRPGRTGDVEARFAVETAKSRGWGKPGDLVLAVDVEESAFSSVRDTRRYVREFVREYRRLTGHWPMFYSFPHFIATVGFGRWIAKRCPLWIAHFGVTTPTLAGAWKTFAIHQHTSTGRVAGIAGNVDLNRADRLPLIPTDVVVDRPPTRRQKLLRSLRRRRARFLDVRTDAALRKFLFAKARLGRYDKRYCLHFGPDDNVNDRVKAYVTRGFAAGLVPTSLRRPPRFPGDRSHHIDGNAGDMGVRRELLPSSSPEAQRRMRAFQAQEFKDRGFRGHRELIGPDNDQIVLRGQATSLAEGSALETQHDTHVHGAFV